MFLFPIHPLYNREMFWKTLPSVASQQCCEILILLYQLNSCLFLPPYTKVKSEGYLVPFLPRWQIRQSRGGWLSYYVHLLLQSQRQRQTASNCGGSANENKRTCSRSLIFLLTGLRLKAVKTQKLNNSLPLSCGPSWWNLASPKLYRLAGDFCSEVCLPEPAPREEILTAGEDQYITSPACIITNVSYRPSYYVILPSQLFVYLMINRQDLCLTHLWSELSSEMILRETIKFIFVI